VGRNATRGQIIPISGIYIIKCAPFSHHNTTISKLFKKIKSKSFPIPKPIIYIIVHTPSITRVYATLHHQNWYIQHYTEYRVPLITTPTIKYTILPFIFPILPCINTIHSIQIYIIHSIRFTSRSYNKIIHTKNKTIPLLFSYHKGTSSKINNIGEINE